MPIQLEFNDTKNFTGRSRIRQKNNLFALHFVEREEDAVRIKVTFDRKAIEKDCKLDPAEEKKFILDSFVLGESKRHVLPDYVGQDDVVIPGVPEGLVPEFRLKVISRSSGRQGQILASTSGRIRLNVGSGEKGAGEQPKGILKLVLSRTIGSRIWQIDWSNDVDVKIQVNYDYFQKYNTDPMFAAHVYPEIVREIATGILLRYKTPDDIDEDSVVGEWVSFIEQKIGIPLRGEEAKKFSEDEVSLKLNLVEEIVGAFVDKKWRDGKTLLAGIV